MEKAKWQTSRCDAVVVVCVAGAVSPSVLDAAGGTDSFQMSMAGIKLQYAN